MSRFEDLERLYIKKANAMLEVSEEKSKREHESIYKKIHKLQLEVDKHFKQHLQFKDIDGANRQIHTDVTTTKIIKPATFQYDSSGGNPFSSPNSGTKMPGHAQPISYSQAVTQQPLLSREMKHLTSDSIELQSQDPTQPSNSNHSQPKLGQVIPEIPGDASFSSKNDTEASSVVSELKDNPNDPENAHGSIVTQIDPSRDINNSTDTDEKSTRNNDSITSGDNGDNKNDKHSEDVPIYSIKKLDNEENREEVTNSFVVIQNPSNDSSVDSSSTHSSLKLTSGNASLQPAPVDPLSHTYTIPLRKVMGNQPPGGKMIANTFHNLKLPGYEEYGTITIYYEIPSGKQDKEHPNPGQYYHGTSCTAYVPDSPEGKRVVRLLRRAFEARLIFTVETSHTTGATNAVVWNDIHHKTSMFGGPTKLVVILIKF